LLKMLASNLNIFIRFLSPKKQLILMHYFSLATPVGCVTLNANAPYYYVFVQKSNIHLMYGKTI
ncbi:hypothetical protein, partial [Chroococcidiopsis sp [FACHB-1243]]|uniref:hypothetical protein n=1 Tax=Chroococcidiopsis sp. [FACHB-1243] TaxID=2692781 RepID=UPI001A7E350A